jgi:hypothetical protein
MSATTTFLLANDRDVARLALEYDLHVGNHAVLPLVVLNYRRGMTREPSSLVDKVNSARRFVRADHPIVAECRGLVLEVDSKQRFVAVVAQGFPRFWHITTSALTLSDEKDFDFEHPFTVQDKEDGSFMLVYQFRDQYVCSSRHNFGEEVFHVSPTRSVTKSQLVFETMRSAEKLAANTTYCIELCSVYNRVIRLYEKPMVFLVGMLERVDDCAPFREVHDTKRLQLESNRLNILRPRIHTSTCTTMDEVTTLLRARTLEDRTIEGFVLVDQHGKRLKLKTETYVTLHRLKYLGWVTCTPSFCVPLLLLPSVSSTESQMDWLLRNLLVTPSQRTLLDARIDPCRKVLARAYERVCALYLGLTAPTEDEGGLDASVIDKHIAPSEPIRPILFALARRDKKKNVCWRKYLDESIWRQHVQLLTKLCTLDVDTDAHHPASLFGYCDIQDATSRNSPITEYNDGMGIAPPRFLMDTGEWIVTCFCGKPMRLVTLKEFLYVPRTCHCGWALSKSGNSVVKTYVPRSVIWVCTDEVNCRLTMEAQQTSLVRNKKQIMRGDPLGVPASAVCKNLRLVAHDLLLHVGRVSKWDLNGCYEWLSRAMALSAEDAHMSRMSSSQCRTAIALMQHHLSNATSSAS